MSYEQKKVELRASQGDNEENCPKTLRGLYDCLRKRGYGTNLKEQLDRERESLLHWATKNRCLYTGEQLKNYLRHFKELGGGNEHVVFYDDLKQRVIKITCPPNFGAKGSPEMYVLNLLECNEYLESQFEIVGLVEDFSHDKISDQGCSIIISQPFVKGRKASRLEIDTFLKGVEIFQISKNTYRSKLGDITLYDVRPDNVFMNEYGELEFIDVHISLISSL